LVFVSLYTRCGQAANNRQARLQGTPPVPVQVSLLICGRIFFCIRAHDWD